MADKTIKILNRKAIKRFDHAKNKLSVLRFDELNVIQIIKQLYAKLKTDNQKAYFELAQAVYTDVRPSESEKPDLSWLLSLLEEYDPVTKYVYDHEIDRKRDYATEAVIASSRKPEELQKSLSRWAQFTAHYADAVEWESTLKAYRDSGVKAVIWHTREDEKVCRECGPRDGKIYPIKMIPAKPHWGCRCWLTAVQENGKGNRITAET